MTEDEEFEYLENRLNMSINKQPIDCLTAMKQALEALEHAASCVQSNYLPDKGGHDWDDVMETLRTVIEAAEKQDPVAWVKEVLDAFPLFEDDGLDEEMHHCEWALQQDRKRLHAMLTTPPAAPVQEPDLSGLKPDTQKAIKAWIADGTFVERAIGALQEQEREIARLEKLLAAPVQGPPVLAELLCVCGAEWEWRNRDWELVSTSATTVQEPVTTLLLQSKQNFEHNFGPCWQADWIYSDLAELLDATPPAAQPASVQDDMPKIGCVNHDCDKCKAAEKQEPVAWGNLANWCLDSDRVLITDKTEAEKYHRDVYDLTPLYTNQPAAQRQWVGLTDDEIAEAVGAEIDGVYLRDFRAIEAKLREKNSK